MRNKGMLLTASLMTTAVMLTGCAEESSSNSRPTSSGSERLTWESDGMTFDRSNSSLGGDFSSQSVSVSLSLSLTASLTPPTVNGGLVYATDIRTAGTKVYVSYNTPGANYGGAIDVIDTLVPALPVLTSTLSDPLADFNQLMVSGGSLYSVGAMDTGLADSAIVRKYALTLGNVTGAAPLAQIIPGAAGVGLTTDGTRIYTASGNNGGLSILSPTDLSITTSTLLDGARDVSLRSGAPIVLTGKTASSNPVLKTYNTSGVLQSTSGAMSNAVIDEAKATLVTGTYLNLATAGEGGVNVICASNGTIMNTIANPVVAGLTSAQSAANAAAFGLGLIFVANGGAGIRVYALEQNDLFPSCNVTPHYVGNITFSDGTSVNNVSVSGGYLIAATGAGGFKIILLSLVAGVGLMTSL